MATIGFKSVKLITSGSILSLPVLTSGFSMVHLSHVKIRCHSKKLFKCKNQIPATAQKFKIKQNSFKSFNFHHFMVPRKFIRVLFRGVFILDGSKSVIDNALISWMFNHLNWNLSWLHQVQFAELHAAYCKYRSQRL